MTATIDSGLTYQHRWDSLLDELARRNEYLAEQERVILSLQASIAEKDDTIASLQQDLEKQVSENRKLQDQVQQHKSRGFMGRLTNLLNGNS